MKKLTNYQWVSVCDNVELNSFVSTTHGRDKALISKAKEFWGDFDYCPPEHINFRLRNRERKLGLIHSPFEIITLDSGEKIKVGFRDKDIF